MTVRFGFGAMLAFVLLFGVSPIRISADEPTSGEGAVDVNLTVNPGAASYTAALTTPNNQTTLKQNSNLAFDIAYSTSALFDYGPVTVEAEWGRGTLEDSLTPTIDVVTYEQGSATPGYDQTPPIISLTKQTIDWTIPKLPAETTDQHMSFKLKTATPYTGSKAVTVPVTLRIILPGAVTADQTTTITYRYQAAQPAISPTLTPSISTISIINLDASSADVAIETSTKTKRRISYGLTPKDLGTTLSSDIFATTQTLHIPGLLPETNYYLRVTAIDQTGQTATSDVLTFRTAQISVLPTLDFSSFSFASGGTSLADNSFDPTDPNGALAIPQGSDYEFQITLSEPELINQVQAVVASLDASPATSAENILIRNRKKLGINYRLPQFSFIGHALAADGSSDLNELITDMVQIRRGVYSGKLKTPEAAGRYQVALRVTDIHGNIHQQVAFTIKVVEPLRIRDGQTKTGIEKARVAFERYDSTTYLYTLIPSQSSGFVNPSYTDPNGQLSVSLPKGQYQATVQAIGYQTKTTTFSIGQHADDILPTIDLDRTPASVANTVNYYGGVAHDLFSLTGTYIQGIATSNRFYDLHGLLLILLAIIATLLAFTIRTRIPLTAMPWFFFSRFMHKRRRRHEWFILGRVVDDQDVGVSRAHVYLIDGATNTILSHTLTDRVGEFQHPRKAAATYKVLVMKKGYEGQPLFDFSPEATQTDIHLVLKKLTTNHHVLLQHLHDTVVDVFGMGFEFLLVLSLILEIIYTNHFGLTRTWPMLLVSLVMLVDWLIYLQSERHYIRTTSSS